MKDKLTAFFASRWGIITVGAVFGFLAAYLAKLGNPPNMGVCVACFERDVAGALGLHRAPVVQYLRPEVPAFVLGSLLAALAFGEFRPRGGSAPIIRFVLGIFAMIGALVFLGCPWRALLRLSGGDLNAVVGIAGLAGGIGIGGLFLKKGFTLGRARPNHVASGLIMPGVMLVLLVMVFAEPDFIFRSEKGPGSMYAAVGISLGVGLLIGFLAQRTRFCTMGAIRDALILRDFHLLFGIISFVVVALATNFAIGRVNIGIEAQPVAHSDHVWNFLGMALTGMAFSMAGGCPGRQLFLSGEGDGDSAIFVMGMVVGGGLAHNFLLAARPDKVAQGVVQVGGPILNGQVAVALGIAFCLVLGFAMREKFE